MNVITSFVFQKKVIMIKINYLKLHKNKSHHDQNDNVYFELFILKILSLSIIYLSPLIIKTSKNLTKRII